MASRPQEIQGSNFYIVTQNPPVPLLKVVKRDGGNGLALFDDADISNYLGIVIERLDKIDHRIIHSGIYKVDLPNGVYYSDGSGNLTTTVGTYIVGYVNSGYIILNDGIKATGGGGATVWGAITGDINNQTDLINLINQQTEISNFTNCC